MRTCFVLFSILLALPAASQTLPTARPADVGMSSERLQRIKVDPIEDVIGIIMTQVRPYTHLNIQQEFQVLVNQAIVDGGRKRAPSTTSDSGGQR
jgi:hypothetical protein